MVLCFSILCLGSESRALPGTLPIFLSRTHGRIPARARDSTPRAFECSNSSSWGLIGYQSKLQICNVVWSSQSRHCKRRGNDTRAHEVVGLVVGTAGATSAAAELRRRPRFIILGTRRMRDVKPLRLGLFPSGQCSDARLLPMRGSDEETNDPLIADHRNFYEVEN